MYNQTEWQDRVTQYDDRFKVTANPDGTYTHKEVPGEIIQVGTPQNQTNFNNIENGIQDATLAAQIINWSNHHHLRSIDAHMSSMDSEVTGEVQTVTLTNTATYPFNSTLDSPVTVALKTTRKNLFYTVEAEVAQHDGEVGDIEISGKALNGFKIAYTGSGAKVVLTVRIKGGMA